MNNTKNILVTGANGQLGMELRDLEKRYNMYRFMFSTREQLPITNKEMVAEYFSRYSFTHCINCAAYTAVDKAESEPDAAFETNAAAAANLAAVCKKYNTQFIHISTDYVFEGEASVPYTEVDPTDPKGIYAASKLEGEKEIFKNNDRAIVIRTSWLYSSYGKNFVKTMLRLMKEKDSIAVVNDQTGSPTYAADLAVAILEIISAEKENTPGRYHYCNEGIISWYEFASAIKMIISSSCIIHPIPTTAYPTVAKRPKYSALDTALIRKTFGITIPYWKDSLEKCIRVIDKDQ